MMSNPLASTDQITEALCNFAFTVIVFSTDVSQKVTPFSIKLLIEIPPKFLIANYLANCYLYIFMENGSSETT